MQVQKPVKSPVPDVNLMGVKVGWEEQYGRWYVKTFGGKLPEVSAVVDARTGETTYEVRVGYPFHTPSASAFVLTLQKLKDQIPKKDYYSVLVSDGVEEASYSYLSQVIDFFVTPPKLDVGKDVSLRVEGGPDKVWRRKAGFIFANILADVSFNYDVAYDVVNSKWNRLLEIMKA